jgi:preprotein translocase subunit YajC
MTTHPLFALLFAPSGQSGGGGLMFLVGQLALIFAIFYFLVIRPQRRQQEQHRQLLASLQRGDQVVTTGGVVGEVIHIKDDQVTIRSGESRFIVVRSGIANITNRTSADTKSEAKVEAKAK